MEDGTEVCPEDSDRFLAIDDFEYSLQYEDVELLRSALKRGASVNGFEDLQYQTSPLVRMFENESYEMAEVLLEHGVSLVDDQFDNVIVRNVVMNDIYGMELLLRYNADIHYKVKKQEESYNLLMMICMPIYGRYDYGCHKDMIDILISNGVDVNEVSESGYTILPVAIKHADEDMVNILLEKGANINVKDKYGTTPLMLALCRGEFIDIVMEGLGIFQPTCEELIRMRKLADKIEASTVNEYNVI